MGEGGREVEDRSDGEDKNPQGSEEAKEEEPLEQRESPHPNLVMAKYQMMMIQILSLWIT